MADVPLKKLCHLLKPDRPAPVRYAAAVVAGELGIKDAELLADVKALLKDPDGDVRIAAVRACGQLKIADALPTLLEKVGRGGPEAAPAAEAAANLGAKGIAGLQGLLHTVAPGVKRYIAAALTSTGDHAADAVGVTVIADKDPQISNAAAASVIGQLQSMPPERKKALAEELALVAGNKKKPLPPAGEQSVVRVLAALAEPVTADVLWARVVAPYPAEIRATALQAVGGWASSLTKDQWKKLFTCATESDFKIAAPAVMILSRLTPTAKSASDWVPLLTAPDIAARQLGIEKLGGFDDAAVAEGLLANAVHPNRGVAEAAAKKLAGTKAGRAAVLSAVADAPNADVAWPLARLAATFDDALPPALRQKLLAAAGDHLAAKDHRADPLLFLLREADPKGLQDTLLETAVGLRKKKKYDAALEYLKVLARDPGVGFAVRSELALCGLKVSAKDVDPHSRMTDPCLKHLDTLFAQNPESLRQELEKAKFLEPEDLFYAGFHFAEQIGRPRQFGIDLLKLVAARSPKSEVGKSAKNKVKAAGG